MRRSNTPDNDAPPLPASPVAGGDSARPGTAEVAEADTPAPTHLLPTGGHRGRRGAVARPGRGRRQASALIVIWLLGLLGGALGLFLLLLIAPHHSLLSQVPPFSNPDITISISENYLNTQAAQALKTTHPIVLPYVTVTGVEIDLQPGNKMRLQPTFHAAIFDVAATVENNVRLDNGQLALQMNGDPKLQDIPIPLDLLPFNLPQQVRQAVDQINNDLLSSEMNRQISAGFGSTEFRITSITTDDTTITFKLNRK